MSKLSKMAWAAPSARALLAASPITAEEPPAIGGERITEWLKITAVPLLVFLIGACLWGCMTNAAAWRVLTGDGGRSTHIESMGGVRADAPRAISNNEAARDLETGLELSQVLCRELSASLKSAASSIATNAAMGGDARPNSDIGDAVDCGQGTEA